MSTGSATEISIPPVYRAFLRDAFEAFLAERDEPDWLIDRRRRAFDCFEQSLTQPLEPEEWKRLDLRLFHTLRFTPPVRDRSGLVTQVDTMLATRTEFGASVSHTDGTAGPSGTRELPAGVVFCPLTEAVRVHEDIVREHLMTRAVLPDTDRFSAWHAAFWNGGVLLYVPRGVVLDRPLHSVLGSSAADAADFAHTLVVLDEGASATLLEETASLNAEGSALHVGAVELLVGRGAHLRYVQIQNWNERTWHFAHQAGRVEQDGFLQWTVGGLGARFAHIHQTVSLDGRGAGAEVNGVSFATGRRTLSYYTQQTHCAASTRSDLLYKSVLRDRSRVVWRGMIRVEPEAQQTDGYQRCDALLLSPESRMDAIPGLEIEADDVRCTHGATVGRVDDEQLFYCMTRGLTQHEAMHLIVSGFFQSVFDRIPVTEVREAFDDAVVQKLGLGD
ncbi:MAG: Fe-S cluster assembly protein SufD [Planctomycetota bacterium]|nr:MAG: Fe-S cluster assembly protein SufD [Planctomycetota bacterium]